MIFTWQKLNLARFFHRKTERDVEQEEKSGDTDYVGQNEKEIKQHTNQSRDKDCFQGELYPMTALMSLFVVVNAH